LLFGHFSHTQAQALTKQFCGGKSFAILVEEFRTAARFLWRWRKKKRIVKVCVKASPKNSYLRVCVCVLFQASIFPQKGRLTHMLTAFWDEFLLPA